MRTPGAESLSLRRGNRNARDAESVGQGKSCRSRERTATGTWIVSNSFVAAIPRSPFLTPRHYKTDLVGGVLQRVRPPIQATPAQVDTNTILTATGLMVQATETAAIAVVATAGEIVTEETAVVGARGERRGMGGAATANATM